MSTSSDPVLRTNEELVQDVAGPVHKLVAQVLREEKEEEEQGRRASLPEEPGPVRGERPDEVPTKEETKEEEEEEVGYDPSPSRLCAYFAPPVPLSSSEY